MKLWIVRKHPRMPYRSQPGHLAAFTIHGTYATRDDAAKEATERNKRSSYLFTVAKIELREKKA